MAKLGCLATAAMTMLRLAAAEHVLFKGVSYGPVPLKTQDGIGNLPEDDWMADAASSMWGRAGRQDLRVIREMGANLVRLYGNNPANDHTNFLDAAHAENLWVFPGMSDYPYYQQVPGSCRDNDYDCYSNVKAMYTENLRKGFLTPEKTYHPALKVMNILNEPDLKMPFDTCTGGPEGPVKMAKTLISAFDAMLDAEKDAEVTGPLINFTATFSYAVCGPCTRFSTNPGLGQMAQLDDAMHNPENYGYTPRNDITAAYKARWVHSFNTQNPATDLQHQFLDDYEVTFPTTPVYIGEYHRVNANQTEDLGTILEIAERSGIFLGISYFQYQVAYWKTGPEMDFGMFGLGDYVITDMDYFGQTYPIYCLDPRESVPSGMSMPNAVAHSYGSAGIDADSLCLPNPWAVALSAEGYAEVVSQDSASQMSQFLRRVVEHLGATVTSTEGLEAFAEGVLNEGTSWEDLVSQVAYGPSWVTLHPGARCAASRDAPPAVIGTAIGWVCEQASFSCADVPAQCNSTYKTADWIFSRYYKELGSAASPLTDCNFNGAGVFAAPDVYNAWTGAAQCIEGATGMTTSSPDVEGTTSPDVEGTTEQSTDTTASTTGEAGNGTDDGTTTTGGIIVHSGAAALSPVSGLLTLVVAACGLLLLA